MRVPGGGASCLDVGRPASGALPPPTCRPFRRAAGTHYPLAVRAGGAGVGTRHQPHSTRSCDLALRAVGAACGCPGGAPLAWVWGVRGRAPPPPPTTRPFGRAARAHYPLAVAAGVRLWGPVTNPTARALASCLRALWGRHVGARGGAPLAWVLGVLGRAAPTSRPFGRAARAHYPLAVGAGRSGRGDPSPNPQRALLRAGSAHCGCPGGGASCLAVGRLGSGALPPPTSHPLGRATGAHYPPAAGARGAGVETRHEPHSARSCELASRAVGAACECPGRAPFAWVWGVWGRALSHPRPLVRSSVRPGPTTHCLLVRGMRAWGPVTNPTARALVSWLCALWGRQEGNRGGGLLPGCGASGDGRSPAPDLSSFRACARGPLPTGRGCGVRAWGPGCPWHLLLYRGSLSVLRAPRVRGTRWPLWLGTCPCAVVVAGGMPLAPRLVRSLSVLRSAFRSLWCLPPPRGLSPPALLGGCAGHVEAGRESGSLCLPLAPAEARAMGSLRFVPVWGPAMGLSLLGLSGSGPGLRALRLFVCVDPVTDASGFPFRPSFDGGLGGCTGAVCCGRQHRPLWVGGRHARVPRVCVCVLL